MTAANLLPVPRTALLATFALLGALALASSCWGSTGGKGTICDPRPVHGKRSPVASRHRRSGRSTACPTHHRIGSAHAIAQQRAEPTAGTQGGGVEPSTGPPFATPALPSAAEAVTASPPAPPPPPAPPLEPPPPPPPPSPAPEPPAPDSPSTEHSIYWGAWIKNPTGEAPWSMPAASQFEQLAGKAVSVINWSSPFSLSSCNGYCAFKPAQFNAVRDHGAIPFFSWNPGPGTGAFTDAQIAAGAQDGYIAAWAQAAKQWGHPFFLRFAWEMNGSWFPWGVGNNGTTAADYVAMWHHVHDVFASVGATNVTWVWCPNIDPYGHHAPMAGVYPGDEYVDWTCLDGYNGADPWKSFSGLFESSYEAITDTIAPDKPMIVGETASTEASGSKAEWISDTLGELPTAFPKIRGLLWFDKVEAGPGDQTDWPIESSTTASSAFAAGVQDPVYAGNEYGDLAVSPIPTP